MRETWVRSLGWEDSPPRRRIRLLTPVFWPAEFHGLYSPRGLKWSDRTDCISPWLNGFEENVSKTLYLMPFSLAFIDQTTDSSFSIFLLPLESINSVSTHLSVCMLSHFSCVHLFVTPWAVARQAPLYMGFSRQGYWSVSPCPPPGHLPNPGIEPVSVMSLALARDFFTTSTTREALMVRKLPVLYLSAYIQVHMYIHMGPFSNRCFKLKKKKKKVGKFYRHVLRATVCQTHIYKFSLFIITL